MESVIDVDAVGDGATRRERPVMGRGYEDLRRLGHPGQRGRRVPEQALAAAQEVLDEADAAFDLGRGRRSEPEIPDAAVTSADAEHGPAATQEGEGSNRRRRGRWVPRDQIRDADGDGDVGDRLGEEPGGDPRVHRDARRVGDPDHVVAVPLRCGGHPADERRHIGPEEEADLHVLVHRWRAP
jgi:hypothetical protein